MTDDRGLAALAERLRNVARSQYVERPFGTIWHDLDDQQRAAAILGEHGAFLPDGREVERLRAVERAACEVADEPRGEKDGYRLNRLRAALEEQP